MAERHDDIERYLKGEMTPEEMHALEKRSLSDPLLREALEGTEFVSQVDFSKDVEALKDTLGKRTRKTIGLWEWTARIAAGLVLLAIATFLIVRTFDKPPAPVASVEPNSSEDSLSNDGDGLTSDTLTNSEGLSDEALAARRRRALTRKQEELAALPPVDDLVRSDSLLIAEYNAPAPPAAIVPKIKSSAKVIHGTVIDAEDGRALPGVNVTIKGTNIGTITDEEGNYQIPLDSLSDGLVFSYIGFESAEIMPKSAAAAFDVALRPDVAQLSEVVVVGYSPTAPPANQEAPVIEMAAPDGGRKAYKQYLDKSLRYPVQALNSKVEGRVTVQFTVSHDGTMSGFEVLKGIGYGCDDEVIRLIKSGPKWSPTKRNHEPVADKVKVRVRFSLPKDKR